MNGRVGKRQRRVAEAEVALTTHRLLLREEVRALAVDARAAVTPGRVVVGGLALGALTGLAAGGRSSSKDKEAVAKPGALQSLTSAVRLVSMLMPMLTPILGMVQGHRSGSADPAASATGAAGAASETPSP